MNGLIILTEKTIYQSPFWADIISYVGAALAFVTLLAFCWDSFVVAGYSFIAALTLIFSGIFLGIIFQQPSYTQYEVTFTETISLAEFNEKYEVLEQRDKIYVIKEKEIENQ